VFDFEEFAFINRLKLIPFKTFRYLFPIVFEVQIAMTLNNIASLYMELSDWERAKTYLDQAINGYLNSDDRYNNSLFLAIMYANLSVIL
tara:strand:+ start:258 stop:524 length:267 start_codon:yes stop_codon:yes gene_type:complete